MYKKLSEKTKKIIQKHNLSQETIKCEIIAKGTTKNTPLEKTKNNKTTEHRFKLPSKEYALTKGKEVLVRSQIKNSYGDAFTDKPKTFKGKLKKIPELAQGDKSDKAIFFSALNATLNEHGKIETPVHCKQGDPIKCGKKLVEHILNKFGKEKIAHIGYHPGHLEACSKTFKNYLTDLNPENIGKQKFRITVQNGTKNEEVIEKTDIACITSSSIVNGSLPQLLDWCEKHNTEPIIYGVSGVSAVKLLNLNGFCPYGRETP